MISWHGLLIYCGVYGFAIATPGPGIFAIVARALGSGFRTTLPMAAGTMFGDLTVLTLTGYLQICAATAVLIPTITLGYTALASRLSGVFAGSTARRRMNKGAAIIMAGAGVGVAVS